MEVTIPFEARVGSLPFACGQTYTGLGTTLRDLDLYWGWRSGFVFLRIDGRTTGGRAGYSMHLGSTDCAPPPPGKTTGTAGCDFPNRPEISLEGFELEKSKVVLDVASLLADSNLDADSGVPNTSLGCMSQKEDPDCAPVFNRLGISFDSQSPYTGVQSFVRME